MEKKEVTTILDGLTKDNKEVKLHFTCHNNRFYNGVLIEINKKMNFVSITDLVYGYTIIPFSFIIMISLYREKP